VHENPDLLVTRPVEPHLGGCAPDAAVHLGYRDTATRLPFDLVEKAQWDPWREGEHAARIAGHASRSRANSMTRAQQEPK
jgi:hypothetical protein